jgi:hypothetical protein
MNVNECTVELAALDGLAGVLPLGRPRTALGVREAEEPHNFL